MLASANPHKAAEFARLLPGYDVTPFAGELPAETGTTFLENARLKAQHVHRSEGGTAWVLADDSGIEAAALGGAPGVYSARYAGDGATDAQNLAKLLGALRGGDDRRVRYVAELVAIAPDGRELRARGELSGDAGRRAARRRRLRLRPGVRPRGRDAHGRRDERRREGRDLTPRPRGRPAAPPAPGVNTRCQALNIHACGLCPAFTLRVHTGLGRGGWVARGLAAAARCQAPNIHAAREIFIA